MSAFFISSKFEDIYAPEAHELKYLCENAYTCGEILKKEQELILMMNFNLILVSPLDILE